MKDKILEIIKNHPKHYSLLIGKNNDLKNWVVTNSLIQSDYFPEMIYSAINQESNICKYGNIKTISRISEGWVGCGPASKCQCTKENIAKSVSISKLALPESEITESNNKRKSTLLSEYGYEYNSQRPEVKTILSKPKISQESYNLLNDIEWLTEEYLNKQRSLVDIAQELKVFYGTVGEYCRKLGFKIRQRTNYSKEEKYICDFLDSINVEYIKNDWEILENKEIDIYIPKYKIGIEINGLYWHSYNPYCNHTSAYEDKNRHIDKLTLAKTKGIDLLQITDFEINNKKEIIESIIQTRLGISKKIYARNCVIKTVKKEQEKEFLNKNHLQGFCGSSLALGLYLNDELLSIITFGKSRYSKIADIELLRLCTKINHVIVGGIEKLFKESLKYIDNKKIVSYCDNSKFNGKIYQKLGFILEQNTKPGYFWTDGTYPILRQKCQHKNLSKWLKTYDCTKSESENLFLAKYRRYWDCGQQTWMLDTLKNKQIEKDIEFVDNISDNLNKIRDKITHLKKIYQSDKKPLA